MLSFREMDTVRSFQMAKLQIEQAFQSGKLTRKEARETLEEARKSYRDQTWNKAIVRRGLMEK